MTALLDVLPESIDLALTAVENAQRPPTANR